MTPNATINVSVSSHYREPSYGSEVVSQGLLGERVEILEPTPIFTRIRQPDGYISWISSDQVSEGGRVDGLDLLVTSHFMRIYKKPSVASECLKDGVIGCRLVAVEEQDDWYQVLLPDGRSGWVEKTHFGSFPDYSPENILSLARTFLGYQYVWGGRSPKGFDCSGLVQTLFGLHGILLPRDTWQQQQHNIISTDFLSAEPGDLLFFAKTPERITHVVIVVDRKRFIHASGWVRYNSLIESEDDFSEKLLRTFVSVNRYPAGTETS